MTPIVWRGITHMLVAVLGILAVCLAVVAPSAGNATHAAAATHGTVATGLVDTPNCAQPPTNVDHATFTDAQLDLYGLPHRLPGQPLAQWQKMVRAAKHRVCTGIATTIRPTQPKGHKGNELTTSNENLSWGGYIAYDGGYTDAVQQWKQPCLTLLQHNGAALSWAGLGGDDIDGGGNLIQSGTVAREYQDGVGRWVAQYYAFIEDVPWNPSVIEKFTINCGDTMYASDYQDYSGGHPIDAKMYINDVTSGQYALSTNTNAFSNGSTAEWIMENARGGNWGTYNLADFGSVTYNHVEATRNGAFYNPINLPHNYSDLFNNGDHLVGIGSLGQDSSDSGAHFTITWLHSS